MPGSKSSNEPPEVCKSPRISADDSEDESEILEESPCGRWLKRREEVEQRDVPGIDVAYLAMDTEEGVEVVWNEVQFSERKKFKAQEEKIRQVFDNLIQLDHPNIVKFHKYWTDRESEKPRIIFITEYMSSGSLKQFLKKTKRNVKKLPLQAWKRWCTQILSALSYLHSCSPPVIHGNLTCDTIFIQHNGLVKIGSVAPDAIHHHVKTCREDMKNMHFIAPEYGNSIVTPAVDIYSFGMCALEMAALEILGNGESGNVVTEENINKTIELIEEPLQKSFIRLCLEKNHLQRLSASDLLFQPIIYEVHPLKLIAAHAVNKNSNEAVNAHYGKEKVISEIVHKDGRPGVEMRMSNAKVQEKLEKFMEDVRNGIYPLTAFGVQQSQLSRPRTVSPEIHESTKSETPEVMDVETRRAVYMLCSLKPRDDGQGIWLTVLLRMEDKMNRQLTCELLETDSSYSLTEELVHYGFICDMDRQNLTAVIEDALRKRFFPEENRPVQIMVSQQVMNQQVVSQAVVPPPSGAQPSMHYMPPSHMTVQGAS